MFNLEFDLDAHVNMVAAREKNPFISTYLTKDLLERSVSRVGGDNPKDAPKYAISNQYQTRLINHVNETNVGCLAISTKTIAHTSINNAPSETNVKHHVSLAISKTKNIEIDASVCFHVFCDVECEHSVWGSHTCGWANMTLYSLARIVKSTAPDPTGYWHAGAKFSDPGGSPTGTRGSITVSFNKQTADILAGVLSFVATSGDPTAAMTTQMQAFSKMMHDCYTTSCNFFTKYNAADKRIDMIMAPEYISCGNRVTRPPCAFIMTSDPPLMGEEYYLNALQNVLVRRLRYRVSNEKTYINRFVDCVNVVYPCDALKTTSTANPSSTIFTPNELGSVLIDVALFLSVGCTYLFDAVMSNDGSFLDDGEDFSRLAPITLCADCEDYAYNTLMCCREIAVESWQTNALKALKVIRMQYISFLTLKSVGHDSQTKLFGAHDCCDLIPIVKFGEMVRGAETFQQERDNKVAGIVQNMIDERISNGYAIKPEQNKTLLVVVGEGTGRLTLFPRENDRACVAKGVKDCAMDYLAEVGFAGISTAFAYNLTTETAFYQYTTWGIVGDTLDYCRKRGLPWTLSHVAMMSRDKTNPSTLAYGVCHTQYVTCNGAFAMPMPPPSAEEERVMVYLEKYEHPSAIVATPKMDLAAYEGTKKLITDWVAKCNTLRTYKVDSSSIYMVDVYTKMFDITQEVLDKFVKTYPLNALNPFISGVWFEHVTDGIAFAIFEVAIPMQLISNPTVINTTTSTKLS